MYMFLEKNVYFPRNLDCLFENDTFSLSLCTHIDKSQSKKPCVWGHAVFKSTTVQQFGRIKILNFERDLNFEEQLARRAGL